MALTRRPLYQEKPRFLRNSTSLSQPKRGTGISVGPRGGHVMVSMDRHHSWPTLGGYRLRKMAGYSLRGVKAMDGWAGSPGVRQPVQILVSCVILDKTFAPQFLHPV